MATVGSATATLRGAGGWTVLNGLPFADYAARNAVLTFQHAAEQLAEQLDSDAAAAGLGQDKLDRNTPLSPEAERLHEEAVCARDNALVAMSRERNGR